jgi:MFS family permease
MNLYRFFLANRNILLFGLLLTFFSGFGQTFLLALYIPEITSELNISHSLFSTTYALATMCSGLTIIVVGRYIDHLPLFRFTLIVIIGIILANLVAALAVNLVLIFLAIFMLRFFGQGLLSHTSITAMGRYFTHARGKALSIAQLGYPISEVLMPVSIITIIMLTGWRVSFIISAAVIALSLLPLSWLLLRNFNKSKIVEPAPALPAADQAPHIGQRVWAQKEIIQQKSFYTFAPTVFIAGFTFTALFFFQSTIANQKGWSLEWMALSISAYAISTFIVSILSGFLIDRFSAGKIFPFLLLPMAAGLLVLNVSDHPAIAMVFWALVGVSAGANPTTANALYAETYGVQSLGSIRSLFSFIMIFSTAAGPVVYSFLMESGSTIHHNHLLIAGAIAVNFIYIKFNFRRGNL